jgi:hypothetical protein
MAAINNITFTGKSGIKYDFHAFPINEDLQPIAAVYALTRCVQNRLKKYSHDIIYIAETVDLSECRKNQEKEECIKEKSPSCICLYPEKSLQKRLRIMVDLIENYHPVCCCD